MVCAPLQPSHIAVTLTLRQIYPMGFGQGSAGSNGNGFQLLVILFMLLFGVSLGQMVAALSPSVQVIEKKTAYLIIIQRLARLGCCPFQSFHSTCSLNILRCHNSLSNDEWILEVMALSTRPIYTHPCRHGIHRASVSYSSPTITPWLTSYVLVASY